MSLNPKKIWKKLRPKGSKQSTSSGQKPSSDSSVARSSAIEHPHAASSVTLATIGSQLPLQSHGQPSLSAPSVPTLHSSQNPITSNNNQSDIIDGNTSSDVRGEPGVGARVYGGVKTVLDVAKESADVFPPLKSALGGLTALFKHYDQFIANKEDVRRLISRVESLTTSLTGPPRENDTDEIKRRSQLEKNLNTVLDTLTPMVEQSNIVAFLNNPDQAAKVTSLIEDIRDAIIDYQTSLQQGIHEDLMVHLTILQDSAHQNLLNRLPRAKGAKYTSGERWKCLRGTRVKVLIDIENWVYDRHMHMVYWLNGLAGTGKTTISQSFAERMFAAGLLGASFFCSRDFIDRRTLHLIFPTLALQLAYQHPEFRSHLVRTLKSDPDAGDGSLSTQLTKLLVEPLRSTGLSTVIIIDALDECEDNEPASAILSLLAREIEKIPSVKFFITGRPEPRIRKGFRLPTLVPHTEVLLLHEVERGDVNSDIRLFLEYHLTELVKDRSDVDITIPWPPPDDIAIIVSKAGGLFIYASTVVKFLSSPHHNPMDRLRLIVDMPGSTVYEGKLGIDPLYTCLLDNGCSVIPSDDIQFFAQLLLVVGSVVLLWEPISIASLGRLLSFDPTRIKTSIRFLHSVLLVPESNSKPIRVFHKSFPDYLTDNQRCRDSRFFVDSSVHHATLAIHCFELMERELKENICGLPQYAMNNDVEDLPSRQQNLISEALVYACRFWAKHLCSTPTTGDGIERILELLKRFVQRHLLQWLEVESIINDVRGAVHSFVDVERWLLKVQSSDQSLLNWVRECRRFILHSFDIIEQSAMHIYHSALVWAPTSSVIRMFYSDRLRNQAKVLRGIDNAWDACIRSIQLGRVGEVYSVAFSHKSNLIAGSRGAVVNILEAATGVCLAILNGHNDTIHSVAFSPDDVLVASGSHDNTVKIWDLQTGGLVRTLEGHTNWVLSVTFSPTGTTVASGSADRTVRIWNLSCGDCTSVLKGHSGWVQSVCWLQTNEVLSGSNDKTIRVWDVSRGECLKTINNHSACVHSVASSADASKIVSGSNDKKLRVYDARTGDVIQTILADGPVRSVCFSPDGDRIVYAAGASVVVWDLVKDEAMFRWQLSSSCVAFSPDGSCVAVGTTDGFLKVFQMGGVYQGDDICDQHSDGVLCVAVAPDGRTIASGSEDKTVKLWDATTGLCLCTFGGHSTAVNSAVFSPNSSLLASCSDGLRIWSLHDRARTQALYNLGSSSFKDAQFSPDGRQIVSVDTDNGINLWDVDTGEKQAFLPGTGRFSWRKISFSVDGLQVILQVAKVVKKWNICPIGNPPSYHGAETSSKGSSLPMILVPVPDETHSVLQDAPYRYSKGSNRIVDPENRCLCWIPANVRGFSSAFRGNTVYLGTKDGRFVVLDLPDISSS